LVGNPSYDYSRFAKEQFFDNYACAFLFLLAYDYLYASLMDKQTKNMNERPKILDEFKRLATRKLQEKWNHLLKLLQK